MNFTSTATSQRRIIKPVDNFDYENEKSVIEMQWLPYTLYNCAVK